MSTVPDDRKRALHVRCRSLHPLLLHRHEAQVVEHPSLPEAIARLQQHFERLLERLPACLDIAALHVGGSDIHEGIALP